MDDPRRARLTATVLTLVTLGISPASADKRPPLRVLAAASLTDVVSVIAPRCGDADVSTSFGGSGALARQIRDGAPADVFLSASPEWIDFLRESGAIQGEAVVFARNRLVCVAPRGSPLAAPGAVPDPHALLRRLGKDGGVAIADPGVPAGEYARAALRRLGLLREFEPHLVGQKDVRAVLHAVERGELEAGFVYATDARIAAVETLFVFDESTHPPIAYRAAVLRHAARPADARRFLELLLGDPARAALLAAAFETP